MLRVQMKHFSFDAKNKLNKISLEQMKQSNQIKEQQKKNELHVGFQGETFKIKPHKHLHEVSKVQEMIHGLDEGRPHGLKTTNKFRTPVIKEP